MSLEQYKKELEKDFQAGQESREKANEDMRFIGVDGGMWEGFLEDTHNSTTKRAKLELDVTSDYVMRFVGEWASNRANVTFTPDDKSTTDDDAELLSGVYRGDFKDNDGQLSTDNAVLEVATCGVGAVKLSTRFVDEEDPENEDQEIVFEPIYNAFNHVIWDENAKRLDKSDAKRVTVLTGYTKDTFEEEYPDSKPSSAYCPTTSVYFNGITPDVIYVAERYGLKIETKKVSVWQNVIGNEIKAFDENKFKQVRDELIATGWEFVRERKIKARSIYKTVYSGEEILEKRKKIAGRYLPIVPFYGFRSFVDNVEYYRGLARKLKDANRTINMGISKLAESSASATDNVPIYTRKQVEGLEEPLADSSLAYKVLNDLEDAQGNPIPSGPVGYLQSKQVDPNTITAIETISNYVQRQTGNAPQDTIDPSASGKAINALRNRENLNTKVVSDNIITALRHKGKVYRSIAGDIYTRSQMKRVLSPSGKVKLEQLNRQTLDPKTGNPVQLNDLTRGKFSVDVEVGPQYESQREATIESIEAVIEKVGADSPYFGPLMGVWMENISGTGLDPLKKFNRQLMLKQGLVEPETDEEKQMIQAIQQQQDPQEELVKAAAEQQRAEAKNLEASTIQKAATTQKDLAQAEKIKAETADIVTDIGIKRTEKALERFRQIPVGPANSTG